MYIPILQNSTQKHVLVVECVSHEQTYFVLENAFPPFRERKKKQRDNKSLGWTQTFLLDAHKPQFLLSTAGLFQEVFLSIISADQ